MRPCREHFLIFRVLFLERKDHKIHFISTFLFPQKKPGGKKTLARSSRWQNCDAHSLNV